jgi:S-adenosylmethionine synthetase
MSLSFAQSPSFLFTSESVTEGHPDKVCDQISDAVLDEIMAHDPDARVACETCAGNNVVVVLGEITTRHTFDIESIVRNTIKEIGYTDPAFGIDYRNCRVDVHVHSQSPDINAGVSESLETRSNGHVREEDVARIGAGDQGMMVGFACDETPELMPLSMALSHRLCRQLANVRRNGTMGYLGPDGKSQVTVEYSYGKPKRIHTIIVSTQHSPDVDDERLFADIQENVINPVIPGNMMDDDTRVFINPSGRFVVGGPTADAGLTGRKILVDTYGGVARHGGGAFSGKDSTKVDRTGAYGARYVAKNVVAAGLAERAELQVSYAIGMATPISVHLETFGTAKIDEHVLTELVEKHFDLRPGALIRDLDLRRPIYKDTAAYGHFGRPDLDLPWERTDKADALRQDANAMAARV